MGAPAALTQQLAAVERAMAAEASAETPVIPVAPEATDTTAVEPQPQTVEQSTVSQEEYNRLAAELARATDAYKTLQGKFVEVPRVHAEIRALREEMLKLKELPREPAKPAREAYKKYVKDEELADVDSNVIDMQARMSKGVAEDVVSSRYDEQMAALKAELETVKARQNDAGLSSMWADVERVHPGARALNDMNDPTWLSFLGLVDEFSGSSYLDIGNTSLSNRDSVRLTKLLDKFYAENPSMKRNPAVIAQAKPRVAGSGQSGNITAPAKSATIKESEWMAFVERKKKGFYKEKPQEADEYEAKVYDAMEKGTFLQGQ